MASAVQSLRFCLRACGRAPAPRRIAPRLFPVGIARPLSTTSVRWRGKEEDEDPEEDEGDEGEGESTGSDGYLESITEKDLEGHDNLEGEVEEMEKMFSGIDGTITRTIKQPNKKAMKFSFWAEEEEDPDYMVDAVDDEDFSEDDIMSMAHGKLEEFREYREYARIAAWQMPLLAKLARPFEAPTAEQCLRFRYTTYMGEFHPAQHKVVVEFSPKDLPLNEAQQLKVKKLLGVRWNPETDIAKISCEQFPHQAQNKRYLGDLVNKLVAEAQNPTDMFEDVPLDTRHHRFKHRPKFPREWLMTDERRKEIDDARQKSFLLDQAKQEAGSLVDGKELIRRRFSSGLPPPDMKVPELVSQRQRSTPTPRMKRQ